MAEDCAHKPQVSLFKDWVGCDKSCHSMESEIFLTKSELRRSIRTRLRAMTGDALEAASAALIAHLQARVELWQRPSTVALFGGLRSEPDLVHDFMPWLRDRGWRTVLFRVVDEALVAHEVRGLEDLTRGPLGVWEPLRERCPEVSLAELSIILVPGLAFSRRDGARLGRGGGFYDRLLSRPEVSATRIGVAYESQMLDELPCEAHDQRVRAWVTEAGFFTGTEPS